MLVGAGLMFIFTHTEVSADDMKESHCEMHKGTPGGVNVLNYLELFKCLFV
jgi:hypothetical protein